MVLSTLKYATVFFSATQSVLAIGTPFGYGSKATGGGNATPQVPSSNQQLIDWLSDSTARVIQLNSIFDFTNFYGTLALTAGSPWTCTPNPQSILNTLPGTCDGHTVRSVTINSAGYGSNTLKVNSNKTLIGKGSNAGLKGIGLSMSRGVSNIIIQNIKITDINGFDPATDVTISNNYFDGTATWSTGCDNHHYRGLILAGNGDKITFAQNWLYFTAGRSPHTGDTSSSTLLYHFVNNYISQNTGHAFDIGAGTQVIAEGNYFENVKTPIIGVDSSAALYFPTTVDDANACQNAGWGRYCEWNRMDSASGKPAAYLNTKPFNSALKTDAAVRGLKPMGVADVPAYVKANAGVGKIN